MAGVSTKEIKGRIHSMSSTKQITKAMEMVASSKLRKAQEKINSSRPYFETLYSAIQDILNTHLELTSPYLIRRSTDKLLFVVIAGDRGLAGGYNSNLLKSVSAEIEGKDVTVLPIGKKAVEFFHTRNIPILTSAYIEAEDVTVGDCFTLAKEICAKYLAGDFDEIRVAYTGFVSVLSQVPSTLSLLPLEKQENRPLSNTDVLYEPDSESVFSAIVPEYLGGILYGALCESRASEQAARRTAMESATQNAEDMIADLNLAYNRVRQSAITQEITEIIAGS